MQSIYTGQIAGLADEAADQNLLARQRAAQAQQQEALRGLAQQEQARTQQVQLASLAQPVMPEAKASAAAAPREAAQKTFENEGYGDFVRNVMGGNSLAGERAFNKTGDIKVREGYSQATPDGGMVYWRDDGQKVVMTPAQVQTAMGIKPETQAEKDTLAERVRHDKAMEGLGGDKNKNAANKPETAANRKEDVQEDLDLAKAKRELSTLQDRLTEKQGTKSDKPLFDGLRGKEPTYTEEEKTAISSIQGAIKSKQAEIADLEKIYGGDKAPTGGAGLANEPKKEENTKELTEDVMKALFQESGGDKAKAMQLAKDRGYSI